MRVLDGSPLDQPSERSMARKKHRNAKRDASNSSEEDNAKSVHAAPKCSHISRSVNIGMLKKGLKRISTVGVCAGCEEDAAKLKRSSAGSQESTALDLSPSLAAGGDVEPSSVFMCLYCAYQGCDRYSVSKHALLHFNTPRSSPHEMAVNTSTWQVWCYTCDDFIDPALYKNLESCVDFVRKQKTLLNCRVELPSGKKSVSGSPADDIKVPHKASVEGNDPPCEPKEVTTKGAKTNAGLTKAGANVPKTGSPASADMLSKCAKVKGLTNLGNTCFFNAVMQNLSQTHLLEMQLREFGVRGKRVDLMPCPVDSTSSVLSVNLGEVGAMSQSLLHFFDAMHAQQTNVKKQCSVNPSELFGQVCKKAPRFKGFQQQDSHELLHYLLDGIKAEEIKRSKGGILKAFNLPEDVKPSSVPEESRLKIKSYSHNTRHTFPDSVFGGYFINTVICEACNTHHQIYEPFLDISLPIIDEKASKSSQNTGGSKYENDKYDASSKASTPVAAQSPKKASKHMTKKQQKAMRRGTKNQKRDGDGQDVEKDAVLDTPDQSLDNTEEHNTERPNDAERRTDAENNKSLEAEGDQDKIVAEKETCEDAEDSLFDDLKIERRTDKDDGSKVSTNGTASSSDADVEDNSDSEPSKYAAEEKSVHSSTDTVVDVASTHGDSHDASIPASNGSESNENLNDAVNAIEGLAESMSDMRLRDDTVKILAECVSDIHLKDNTAISGTLGVAIVVSDTSCTNACLNDVSNCANDNSNYVKDDLSCVKDDSNCVKDDSACIAHLPKPEINRNESSNDITPTTSATSCKPVAAPNSLSKLKLDRLPSSEIEDERNEARRAATGTLVPRLKPAAEDRSVASCLYQFTMQELLSGNNMFICSKCNSGKDEKVPPVKTCANKQMLIYSPPAVLTLHLKRFQQVGYGLRKDSRHVDFPETLDIAPFCSSLCQKIVPGQQRIVYALYGVIEHSGTMRGGHYTAYVKVRESHSDSLRHLLAVTPGQLTLERQVDTLRALRSQSPARPTDENANFSTTGRWFNISDSSVNEVHIANVLRCEAYILFYERVH